MWQAIQNAVKETFEFLIFIIFLGGLAILVGVILLLLFSAKEKSNYGVVAEPLDDRPVAARRQTANVDGEAGGNLAKPLGVKPRADVEWETLKHAVKRAVLTGVNDYAEFTDLHYTGADVELMRKILIEKLGFKPENVVVLTTERGAKDAAYAPTQRNIERELKKALDASGPDDMLFLMFSGHGLQIEEFNGEAPYVGFAPADAVFDPKTIVDYKTTVSLSALYKELEKRNIRFAWAFVDACRENLSEATKSLGLSKRIEPLAAKGVISMTSCGASEYSHESDELGHGVFSYFYAESMSEAGDVNQDGRVMFFEAFARAQEKTFEYTNGRVGMRAQTPYCKGEFADFVLLNVDTAKAKKRYRAAVEARERGDYASALDEIEAACKLAPTKKEYREEKQKIEEQKKRADAEKLEEDAIEAYESGKYEEAISAMERSLALFESEAKRRWLKNFKAAHDKTTTVEQWSETYPAGTRKTLTVDGITYGFVYCPPSRSAATGFWALESEVTVGMFRSFVKATNYRVGPGRVGFAYDAFGNWTQSERYVWDNPTFPQTDEHPVTQVDYNAAVAFCEWLAKETNLPMRLPSESEWEHAARAGASGDYSFGSNVEELTKYANVADASLKRKFEGKGRPSNYASLGQANTVNGDDGYVFTAPVKSFKPNNWNVYDIHGNVYEWCVGPRGRCVLRGGAWNSGSARSVLTFRDESYNSTSRDDNVGFRVFMDSKRR